VERKRQAAELERQAANRFRNLAERFGEESAHKIVARTLWQGATAEMVREMLGTPGHVSSKALKTKKREVWKYQRLDARRFGLHVLLENDVCVGWESSG